MTQRRLAVLGMLGALALGLALAERTAVGQRRGRGERNRVPEPSTVLDSVTSLKCSFPASAAGAWKNGESQAVVQKPADVFTLSIIDIDTQDGTAEVIGLGAPAHVTVKLAGANLHFLDIRLTGALAITTVFSEQSRDGRLKAVHSRSDYLGGRGGGDSPSVSQYYGDCEVAARRP